MGNFTPQIRELVETGFPLFDFAWPASDNYKRHFEKVFIDNYYYREIAYQSPHEFKQRLAAKLNLVMPYYNDLYKTTRYKYDPLINMLTVEEREDAITKNRLRDFASIIAGETFGRETGNETHADRLDAQIDTDNVRDTDTGVISVAGKIYNEDRTGNKTTDTTGELDRITNEFKNASSDTVGNKTGTVDKTTDSQRDLQRETNEKMTDAKNMFDTPQAPNAYGDLRNYISGSSDEVRNTDGTLTDDEHIHTTEQQQSVEDTTARTTGEENANGTQLDKTTSNVVEDTTGNTHGTEDTSTTSDTGVHDVGEQHTKTHEDTSGESFQARVSTGKNRSDMSTVENQGEKQKGTGVIKRTGLNGVSASTLLLEFRDTLINIDQQLMAEFKNLFMGVYNV